MPGGMLQGFLDLRVFLRFDGQFFFMKGVDPERIVGILSGIWSAKAVSVACDIGVFTALSEGAKDIEELARELNVNQSGLKMLLNVCVSLGLLKKTGDRYENTEESETFLVIGKETYLGDFITLIGEDYYELCRGLKDGIITGRPVRNAWDFRLVDMNYARRFTKAMIGVSSGAAEVLLQNIDLSGISSI
ncbi:MAG TPA: hypothetical protein ENG00_00650, partial [Candidatus Aenigmarchaeota archaeon]|nr:hypothetical protein [Candidatus Aenigmarchaeota archaeon]